MRPQRMKLCVFLKIIKTLKKIPTKNVYIASLKTWTLFLLLSFNFLEKHLNPKLTIHPFY